MRSLWPVWLALSAFAAWTIIAVITWAGAAPLGHDESQYAISTRDAVAGATQSRWFYLSVGMHWIARPGIWLGGSEYALRLLPLLLGIAFLGMTYLIGRRSVGATSAAWAGLVLAGTQNVMRYSTDLLSDVPSATAMLAALAVFVDEVDRPEGPRWRIVLAAPLLAAAMYIRYGSVVPIAVIVIAALVVGFRGILRRPLPVIATALVFLVLLVPHFLAAQKLTGSPLGILLESRTVPGDDAPTAGLMTYLTSNPFRYYGTLAPFAMLAGLAAFRVHDRRRLFVWIVAVGSLVAMGLTTHAQPRYVLMSIALLVVLGTDQIIAWLPTHRAIPIVAALVLAFAWTQTLRRQLRTDDMHAFRMRSIVAASSAIRRDTAGARCLVIGYHFTQLEWYSGCRAPLVMDGANLAEAQMRGERTYVVRDFLPNWKPAPQPSFTDFPGRFHLVLVIPGEVEVGRFDRAE